MPILTPLERLGRTIADRYEVTSLLAEGGMGVVYQARDKQQGQCVALKVLKHTDPTGDAAALKRLLREQEALAQLRHPHIVRCLDLGQTEDGVGFIAMELIEGETLSQWLESRTPLSTEELFVWLFPLTGALAYAHRQGVIHRDVKPSNVMLSTDELGRPHAKLLDFGLAKELDSGRVTQSGRTVGTPFYMAPEQARGELAVSAASDVWALGVLCFEALTGKLPFDGGSANHVLIRVATERAPRLSEMADVSRRVGRQLACAIDRALEPQLDRRYADAEAFARALVEAAMADGTPLPLEPDPVGLPQFDAWKVGAQTALQATLSSPAVLAVPSNQPIAPRIVEQTRMASAPPRRVGWRTVAWAAGASLLIGVVTWAASTYSWSLASDSARSTRPLPHGPSQPPAAQATRPARMTADALPALPTEGLPKALPAQGAPSVELPAPVGAPVVPAGARRKNKPRQVEERTPSSNTAAPVTHENATRRSVLDLDPTWR